MDAYAPEDYAASQERALAAGIPFQSMEDLEALYLAPFPSGRFDEKSFPRLWPAREPRLRTEPFSTLEEFDRALAERAIELCLAWADASIGILSLSVSTDETMWAYYAGDHSGMAVGFDDKHPFFANDVRPVTYANDPVCVSSNLGMIHIGGVQWNREDILNRKVRAIPRDLLFRKRSKWKHESEWRILAELSRANSILGKMQTAIPCTFLKYRVTP